MRTLIIPAVLALTASAVLAQDSPVAPAPEEPATMEAPAVEEAPAESPVEVPEAVIPAQEATDLLGSWVIGTTVRSTTGEDIGPIEDILISEQGTINGAVLSVGGFLGFGAKAIAVDWSELQFNYDANEITIALTREQADAAPEYQFREREAPPPPPMPADSGLGGATPAPM